MARIIANTYEVSDELGSGGGGTVFLAEHLRLHKKVVLKVDKRTSATPETLLRREVDVLKNLSNPFIPQVYDYFTEGDKIITVMEYIRGESLDKALRRGERFPQPVVIGWAVQLLQALSYLHQPIHGDPPKGFIHSDIKPANIMRTPQGNICLIDFNIALALGEANVIGCSAGYASPEHYGLDYSGEGVTIAKPPQAPAREQSTFFSPGEEVTVTAGADQTCKRTLSTATGMRVVAPDVRSDIYSLGATLYHLLSGRRPNRDATKVEPLSGQDCSPLVAGIINKAMRPNPEERFQTAEEMLQAFMALHRKDPRVRRLKRQRRATLSLMTVCMAAGVAVSFIGLKRMQTTESWLKLAEYSQDALRDGDVDQAIADAMKAFPRQEGLLTPRYVPQAQAALTAALGIYDLSDGYVARGTVTLPSAPLMCALSPDGKTAACMVSGELILIDTQDCVVTEVLDASHSALAEVEFLDDTRLLYAGEQGLCAYSLVRHGILWQAEPATAIALSADGKVAAAVCRDEPYAVVYDTDSGAVLYRVDFLGRHQQVAENDSFANPNDTLLSLSEDGTKLAVSFSDGSLLIYALDTGQSVPVLEPESGYSHFEGGFSGRFFAFAAMGPQQAVMAVWNLENEEQAAGFQSEAPIHVKAGRAGIAVQTDGLLVTLDPETGGQTLRASTGQNVEAFDCAEEQTVLTTGGNLQFYDESAMLLTSLPVEEPLDFVRLAGGTALAASRDSSTVRILGYRTQQEKQVLQYDRDFPHAEARISADGKHLMLFSYDHFRIYDREGRVIADVEIPNGDQVYDQQFRRTEDASWLEVVWYDGTIACYDAATGDLTESRKGPPPDRTIHDTFETDRLRIESPLHGAATAYDRKTGRLVAALPDRDYLTYITQTQQGIVAQYVTTDGDFYGLLLNDACETLAELPRLCDVWEGQLLMDYPDGTLRGTPLLSLQEVLQKAEEKATLQ